MISTCCLVISSFTLCHTHLPSLLFLLLHFRPAISSPLHYLLPHLTSLPTILCPLFPYHQLLSPPLLPYTFLMSYLSTSSTYLFPSALLSPHLLPYTFLISPLHPPSVPPSSKLTCYFRSSSYFTSAVPPAAAFPLPIPLLPPARLDKHRSATPLPATLTGACQRAAVRSPQQINRHYWTWRTTRL